MSDALKKQAVRGAVFSAIERAGIQLVQFVVSIILARRLAPSEFGLLAMVALFTTFAGLLSSGGFATALIQKKDATHVDESTAFWFNLFVSAVLMGGVYVSAPLIAEFYGQPRLIPITQWCSLGVFFTGASVVQYALLQKKVFFGLRMAASVSGTVISAVVAVVMAVKGMGVWALVAQLLVARGIMLVMVWIFHRWRPLFVFSLSSFRALFGFGMKVLGYALLNTIYENLYAVIIGKAYSASTLGYYHRAKRFGALLSFMPVLVISQVHFPYMCKIQDDLEAVRRDFQRVVQLSMGALLPLLAAMAVMAPDIIVLLVGEKWLPCVPYLRILCATGVFYVLYMLNLDVFKALGHMGLVLKVDFATKLLITISIFLLFRFGVKMLLLGELVCSILSTCAVLLIMNSHIRTGAFSQLWWIGRSVFATIVMILALWLIEVEVEALIVRVPIEFVAGFSVYVIVLLAMKDPALLFVMRKISSQLRGILAGRKKGTV